jgi:hypothetical protein
MSSPGEMPFAHEPLPLNTPSMRLIELLPLQDDGIIRCQMKNVRTGRTVPDYSCLSYVWGDALAMQRIYINERPFQVKKKLWDFLHAASTIRALKPQRSSMEDNQPDGDLSIERERDFLSLEKALWSMVGGDREHDDLLRTLWIDAVCIDQSNNLERNHQVQQMGQIYSRAHNVVAWIGDDPDIARLFRFAQDSMLFTPTGFNRGHEQLFMDHLLWDSNQHSMHAQEDPFAQDHSLSTEILLSGQDPRLLIEKLENHIYWTRAWITQELLLARSLYFFAQNISTSMDDICRQKAGRNGIVFILWMSLEKLTSGNRRGQDLTRLMDNIEMFRYKECSDPRDMVYSLISVSSDGHKLEANYGCSLAELARNVLRVNAAEICLHGAFLLLQVLRLDKALSESDAMGFLIETDGPVTARHIAPCFQCGEDGTAESSKLPPPHVTRMRCICLHCNYHTINLPTEVHRRSHYGHLIVFRAALRKSGPFDWHVSWAPMGGGPWRMLEGHKQIVLDEKGKFKSLKLSVGVMCERRHSSRFASRDSTPLRNASFRLHRHRLGSQSGKCRSSITD